MSTARFSNALINGLTMGLSVVGGYELFWRMIDAIMQSPISSNSLYLQLIMDCIIGITTAIGTAFYSYHHYKDTLFSSPDDAQTNEETPLQSHQSVYRSA